MGTPGQLLVRRYRLVRALGQGGMGMVWEGHDTLLDRPVAIKEVLVSQTLDSRQRLAMIHRTSREARTAARLHHHGIVTVFDVAEEDGRPWIVMELVPSRSLDRVIGSEGPLSVARAAPIAAQMLTALSVAHAAGIVHRDVKPANILIGYDGRVVLSDFGIAISLGDPYAQRSGTVGSPGFLAPERIAGAPATPAGDLWSLGATLYAMVVGRPPASGPMGPLASLLTQDAALGRAPAELRPVLAGLLAQDPARRMGAAQAREMLEALATREPGRPAAARHTRVLAGVAAAAVAAGAIGGWAVLRPSDVTTGSAAPRGPADRPAGPAVRERGSLTPPSASPGEERMRWFDAGEGWRAAVPRGWRLTAQHEVFTWAEPAGTAYLELRLLRSAVKDPLRRLRASEAALSASVREYRRVRVGRVPGGREVVAEWESTWTGPGHRSWTVKGVDYHAVQRLVVSGGRTTVLDWVTTAAEWERMKPTMRAVFDRYDPPAVD
ncbi:hypothetical protein Sru01_64370 [Sphaerisporangium rufum]|uniref:non-specific serine/threonine protein kinase n=1 Tax=Sphaerisporangium rufum TaxID=1381558 RepID=A0A919RCJ3_9ACTN|nr:serine/threonine-protein kinase [Sphaerisporangium rufum]GII81455.1 hypothetical protein Sru01_64370 [Sphaerisporangium rufum]